MREACKYVEEKLAVKVRLLAVIFVKRCFKLEVPLES